MYSTVRVKAREGRLGVPAAQRGKGMDAEGPRKDAKDPGNGLKATQRESATQREWLMKYLTLGLFFPGA